MSGAVRATVASSRPGRTGAAGAQREALVFAAAGSLLATVLGSTSLWAVEAAAAAESLTVLASSELDETRKEVVFRTTTAEEILGEIVEKLTGVDRRVDDQLDELRAQVDDVLSRVRYC